MAGKFLDKKDKMMPQLRLTQHKRFVPYGTHPNPALFVLGNLSLFDGYRRISSRYRRTRIREKCWASFMLGTLYEIRLGGLTNDLKTDEKYYNER